MSQYLGDISAYALAVSQGYTGTEEEYAELMASYATVGQTAVTAAQTATTKASEAATSATTATTKASEATTAATTATNKAAEAQADADAAALDASQALSAASTATSKASEATTAAATATSAKTDAVAANTAAQSAKTAAQTAQTGAETAASSVQSSAAQIATNTSDINELKENLNDKVDLTGENQVTPQNIEGMQFTKTTTEVEGENIFDPSTMVYAEGKYVYVDNNEQINHVTDSDFNAYVIPVEQNAKYVFPQARFAALGKGNERYSEAVGTTIHYATQANTGEATYLFLSYADTVDASTITVKKVTEVNIYSDFVLPEWMKKDMVTKNGVGQVTTKNIEGMTESETVISNNLFADATLVANDKYVAGISGTTGKAYLLDISGLDTYIIPVDGISNYTFTNCRTAIVVSDLEYTHVGELLTYATSIDSDSGKYILFSFDPTAYPVNSYSITKPVTKYTIPSNWIIPDEGDLKKPIDSVNGTGTLNVVGRSALIDGELITFKGFFDTFAEFSLNFTSSSTSTITNYIKVDATNITIKNTTTTPTPQAHGLTIQNDVTLTAQFIDGTMKITLYSNGVKWTKTVDWDQTDGTVSQPQIAPNGMVFTDAMLIVSYDAVKRSIWYFGDSYTGIANPDRWVHYLKEDGFACNVLINGSAGSTSGGANIAFNALLKYGTPKFAVMATGMNDGSDTNGNPPNLWSSNRDAFITACQNNDIEPIFATIPTVPSVNNEAKNAWVRSSGYRYIDFAKAVGADGTGAWYSGMLSGDNVHPTEKGAKALYTQVLIDLPEVTL